MNLWWVFCLGGLGGWCLRGLFEVALAQRARRRMLAKPLYVSLFTTDPTKLNKAEASYTSYARLRVDRDVN